MEGPDNCLLVDGWMLVLHFGGSLQVWCDSFGGSLSQLSVPKVPHLEGKLKVWLRSTVLLALHPMCRLRKQFWEAQLRKANLTWSYNIIWYIWSTVVRSCPDIYICLRLGGCYIEVRSCLGFHGFPIAQIYQIPADPAMQVLTRSHSHSRNNWPRQ